MDSELILCAAVLLFTALSVFWAGHVVGEVAGWALLLVILGWVLTGCSTLAKPQKPGRSTVAASRTNLTATLQQPENPLATSSQTTERITRTWAEPIAPLAPMIVSVPATTPPLVEPRHSTPPPAPEPATTPAPARALLSESIERTSTTIGAAQKDESRTIAAKLASIRPVQYVGILLVLAALAMFHPVVKAVTASTTLQIVTGAVGMLLLFAPLVIVGNEHLLLIAGIALPAIWFVVHRHGRLQGFIDANQDGIDDRRQTPPPTTQ
jgi:hypothetical protein